MKKIIISLSIFAASCGPTEQEYYKYKEGEVKTIARFNGHGLDSYYVVEIDSCEYIECSVYGGRSLCHKGNCKFCILKK